MLTSIAVDPINHFLDQKTQIREQLKSFSGQTVQIQFFPITELVLTINEEGKLHLIDGNSEVDTTLSIPAWKFPQLLITNEHATEFTKISGNKILGNEMLNLLQHINLEYNFAQQLSKIIGDIATHRMIQTSKTLHQWNQKNCEQAIHSVLEFSTEEKKLLIKSTTTHEFTKEIEELSHRIDQLDARVNQLRNQYK